MPKMIGQWIDGAEQIENNAAWSCERVPLTYAQARRLPMGTVMASLNTSDRGSKGSLAKRWYNYFASPETILACPASTDNMRRRANRALAGVDPVRGPAPIWPRRSAEVDTAIECALLVLAGAQ